MPLSVTLSRTSSVGFGKKRSKKQGKILGKRADVEPAGHECFCWPLMCAHLEIVGDLDWRLMCQSKHSMVTGVRMGPDYKTLRNPALVDQETCWRRCDHMD
eukprot:12408045-Karenia_brevis.AAC.1